MISHFARIVKALYCKTVVTTSLKLTNPSPLGESGVWEGVWPVLGFVLIIYVVN